MRLDLFFVGYVKFAVAQKDALLLFEELRQANISPKGVKRYAKTGEIHFSCTRRGAKRLSEKKLPLRVVAQGGVPLLALRLWRRPGLLCGILLAIALAVMSNLVIWNIEIVGNERVSEEELTHELRELGVGKGSFLPHIDTDALAISLRQADSRISFAAINRRGTVLQLQIREAEQPSPPPLSPANLVAKCDGVITMPLIFEGECLIKEGDVVRAGQILAGGVMDSEKHGYRVTRAAGHVLARTAHTYTVNVPFVYEEKVHTGKKGMEVSLFFFDFVGKVFKSTGNDHHNCDIIKEIKWGRLSNGQLLPLGIGITTHMPYEYRTATRSAIEARALAYAELEVRLAADSAGRTMLEKTVEVIADEKGITLVCTVVCEEDIAATVEFEVQNNPF